MMNNLNKNKSNAITAAYLLTMAALAFAAYGAIAISSSFTSSSSPLQAAYAQNEKQQQDQSSAVADKATRM